MQERLRKAKLKIKHCDFLSYDLTGLTKTDSNIKFYFEIFNRLPRAVCLDEPETT